VVKRKVQSLVEFYLFAGGAGLMGYGLRLNYIGDSVLQVVGFWFTGVLVFCSPWILFSDDRSEIWNRLVLVLVPVKMVLTPLMSKIGEVLNSGQENQSSDG